MASLSAFSLLHSGRREQIGVAFRVKQSPHTVLVDRAGTILYVQRGFREQGERPSTELRASKVRPYWRGSCAT